MEDLINIQEEIQDIFGKKKSKQLLRIAKTQDTTYKKCRHSKIIFQNGQNLCKKCRHVLQPECDHSESFEDDEGNEICGNCSTIIPKLDYLPEWRYYGSCDSRSGGDTSRCHMSKENTKGSINQVFITAKLNVAESILAQTQKKYTETVGTTTTRGARRTSIVAACYKKVLYENGDIRTSKEISDMFGIDEKHLSEGTRSYLEKHPKDRKIYIYASDLIFRTMTRIGLDMKHYNNIYSITKSIEKSNMELINANADSLAASTIYFYTILVPSCKTIDDKEFEQRSSISLVTILSILKKIKVVLAEFIH